MSTTTLRTTMLNSANIEYSLMSRARAVNVEEYRDHFKLFVHMLLIR